MEAVATWWGYAEANRTVVAVVVVLVVVAAVGFMARRMWGQRK
jgi:uncharacterized membrane protein